MQEVILSPPAYRSSESESYSLTIGSAEFLCATIFLNLVKIQFIRTIEDTVDYLLA